MRRVIVLVSLLLAVVAFSPPALAAGELADSVAAVDLSAEESAPLPDAGEQIPKRSRIAMVAMAAGAVGLVAIVARRHPH